MNGKINDKWKSRKIFCGGCKEVTIHAYSNNSHKGNLTKIYICRKCETTTITHSLKKKKFAKGTSYAAAPGNHGRRRKTHRYVKCCSNKVQIRKKMQILKGV